MINILFSREPDTEDPGPVKEKKYIVFESQLMALFQTCVVCSEEAPGKIRVNGTAVYITQSCTDCGHVKEWRSQPKIGRIAAGNLLLSASILVSGSMPTKALRMLNIMGVVTIHRNTFFRHQKAHLQPAIVKLWRDEQSDIIKSLKETDGPLVLSADGRSDSPGHTAKFGTVSVIEQRINKVLDVQIVQVSYIIFKFYTDKQSGMIDLSLSFRLLLEVNIIYVLFVFVLFLLE